MHPGREKLLALPSGTYNIFESVHLTSELVPVQPKQVIKCLNLSTCVKIVTLLSEKY